MSSLLLATILAAAAVPPSVPAPKASRPPFKRELVRRTVAVTDATREVAIHVAAGNATTLFFPQSVKKHLLPDSKGYFPAELQTASGRFFVLLPGRDIPAGDAVTLQITLADGSQLPPIVLTSVPQASDLYVEMAVSLKERASSGSAEAVTVRLAELQSRLDECQQSAGEKGAAKVAELVLGQDFRKPGAFVVEKHPARELDKQSRLLVETRHLYRLFDVSYLVVTVENRDPDKLWVLERAEVGLSGQGADSVDARVLEVAQEMSQGIPPGEEAKLVVAFKTPDQSATHRFTLRLLEKAGSRHVTLADLRL